MGGEAAAGGGRGAIGRGGARGGRGQPPGARGGRGGGRGRAAAADERGGELSSVEQAAAAAEAEEAAAEAKKERERKRLEWIHFTESLQPPARNAREREAAALYYESELFDEHSIRRALAVRASQEAEYLEIRAKRQEQKQKQKKGKTSAASRAVRGRPLPRAFPDAAQAARDGA